MEGTHQMEEDNTDVNATERTPENANVAIDSEKQSEDSDKINIEQDKKLVILLEQYSEDVPSKAVADNKTPDAANSSDDEGYADSTTLSDDSGVESDGWEPEKKKKCDQCRRKQNTEIIETPEGQLSYEKHGVKKGYPGREHMCVICATKLSRCNAISQRTTSKSIQMILTSVNIVTKLLQRQMAFLSIKGRTTT